MLLVLSRFARWDVGDREDLAGETLVLLIGDPSLVLQLVENGQLVDVCLQTHSRAGCTGLDSHRRDGGNPEGMGQTVRLEPGRVAGRGQRHHSGGSQRQDQWRKTPEDIADQGEVACPVPINGVMSNRAPGTRTCS